MKGDHISFEKMSEYFDGDIMVLEEKDALVAHVKACSDCGLEFDRLKAMMGMFAELRRQEFDKRSFSADTVSKIRKRMMLKRAYRYMPAAAAVLLILGGYGLFFPSNNDMSEQQLAVKDKDARPAITQQIQPIQPIQTIQPGQLAQLTQPSNETGDVLELIRKNNAKITRVSDNFIEGEVSEKNYFRLKRNLGLRKVVFSSPSHYAPTTSAGQWRNSNIAPVGAGNINTGGNIEDPRQGIKPEESMIKFRIYR